MSRLWEAVGSAAWRLAWPASYLGLRGSVRTRVAIYCGDELLVVKSWFGSGKWGLPGGGLHKDELPVDGAIREVIEETGVVLEAQWLQEHGRLQYRFYGLPYDYFLFSVQLDSKPDITRQNYEIAAVVWAGRESLSVDLIEPDVAHALRYVPAVCYTN